MTRVKRGVVSRKKHHKVLSRTKGYRMTRRRLIKSAKQADLHSGEYAFMGRKLRKRDMRRLWILHISEAVKSYNVSYSQFMNAMKKQNIVLNRKMLNFLITEHPDAFKAVVEKVLQ